MVVWTFFTENPFFHQPVVHEDQHSQSLVRTPKSSTLVLFEMKRVIDPEKVTTVADGVGRQLRHSTENRHKPVKITTINQPSATSRKRRQVQTYEPPPLFSTTVVFVFGATIVLLSNIWTPLALVFVWCAARLQRYLFRINDEPTARRTLLKEFQRKDQLTAPLRQIPNDIKVEEAYWVNRR